MRRQARAPEGRACRLGGLTTAGGAGGLTDRWDDRTTVGASARGDDAAREVRTGAAAHSARGSGAGAVTAVMATAGTLLPGTCVAEGLPDAEERDEARRDADQEHAVVRVGEVEQRPADVGHVVGDDRLLGGVEGERPRVRARVGVATR